MADVTTTVSELPESRVRVEAQVAPEEVDRQLQQAARKLGSQLRIPGFRKGKVPPPVVLRRMGREAVLDEALRSALGQWYVAALEDSGVSPIGDPKLDVGDLPGPGEPLSFSVEIGVLPTATLGDYKGLEVGRREPSVDDEAVEQQIEAARDRFATLQTVERPAESGDQLVADYVGKVDGEPFDGGTARDQLIELGSGRLIPGFEEQLTGVSAGDERTITVTFPDEYPGDLGGKEATFDVTVHEVKAKNLPELDDELAAEASDFDTLAEWREDVARSLREADEHQIEHEFEEAVLQSAADNATVEVPDDLVHGRAHEMIHQTLDQLARQGIPKETYFQIAGKDEHELATEAEPEAAAALRREAVLAAVIEAEGIEPTDAELVEAITPAAERDGQDPAEVIDQLRSADRLDSLRDDVAARKALELLVEAATPISVQAAQARDALWTPEKDAPEASSSELWTPGS